MDTPKYPGSVLDRRSSLLALLGSHWSSTYQGNYAVGSIQLANGQEEAQAHLDILEMVAATSRLDVPIFHTDNWYALTLKESDLNSHTLRYEYGSATYGPQAADSKVYQYDEQLDSETFAFPIPADLRDFKLLLNRITESSVTMTSGVDYRIDLDNNLVLFRENPFVNDLIMKRQIFTGTDVTDRELVLWVYKGQYDWGVIYEQFGYQIGLHIESSQGYLELVNSIFDAYVEGSTASHLIRAVSAMVGIPVVREAIETVELIQVDNNHLVITTNRHAYLYHVNATAVVSVGDVVSSGDPLTDSLKFYDLNRGVVPADVVSIFMGEGFLASGYIDGVTFHNKSVTLDSVNVNGKLKVSWELGGHPGDAEQFWDMVHAKGLEDGTTLANLLDIRPNPTTEPTATSLPATVNPAEFLVQNLLRFNAFIIKVVVSDITDTVGLEHANILRRIIPPWTAMLLIYELEADGDYVTMDAPGDESRPGYTEVTTSFTGAEPVGDSIDPATYVSETITLRLVEGVCY
jgi:hypothetical protein